MAELTLATEWESFEEVLSHVHNPALIMELKRAYYAGALSALTLICERGSAASIPDLKAEYDQFLKTVTEGKA